MSQSLIVEAAAWAIGWSTRQGRAYTRGQVEQAEERAHLLLVEERMCIARELHDVVAHSLSIIAVQAGVGHHVIGSRPDEAAKSLSAIETTTRATLGELRSLLDVLRDDDGAEWLPGGLDDLDTLLEQTRRAGVRVELTISGRPRALPRGLDRAAYRIVQEALTNVVQACPHLPCPGDGRLHAGRGRFHGHRCRGRPHDHPGRRGPRPDRHEGARWYAPGFGC
jgi:signal transduction histidine kinase